jgi:hypothetical protein
VPVFNPPTYQKIVGPQFVTGIVLYDGTSALPFGDGLWAIPLNQL